MCENGLRACACASAVGSVGGPSPSTVSGLSGYTAMAHCPATGRLWQSAYASTVSRWDDRPHLKAAARVPSGMAVIPGLSVSFCHGGTCAIGGKVLAAQVNTPRVSLRQLPLAPARPTSGQLEGALYLSRLLTLLSCDELEMQCPMHPPMLSLSRVLLVALARSHWHGPRHVRRAAV